MAGKFALVAVHLGTVVAQHLLGGSNVLAPDADQQHGPGFLGATVAPVSALWSKMSEDPDVAELDSLEDSLESLVVKGDEASRLAIKHMTDFLVKTLIPIREKQLKLDQQQIDDQSDDVKECSLKRARKSDMHLNDKMEQAAEHKTTYTNGVKKLGECLNVEETRSLIKDAHCASVEDAEKKCMCHESLKDVAGPACKKGTVIAAADKTCCDKFAVYKLHQLKCQKNKENMEYSRLQGGIITDKVCDQYSSCYDKQAKEYRYVEKVVKANEKRRALKNLYGIKCLVEAFDAGKVTQSEVKDCKKKKFDVKSVKFPQIPSKESCTIPKAP
jgi:hypothetical protein